MGASGESARRLAMEAAPPRWRGILSGILQSGPTRLATCWLPWRRDLFSRLGLAAHVLARRIAGAARAVYKDQGAGVRGLATAPRRLHGRCAAHRGFPMEALRVSCRADDLHDVFVSWHAGPLSDFLKEVHGLRPALVANIAMIYTAGAVLGAIIFGHLSQVLGRRKGMMCALALSLAIIPLWAFGWSIPLLIAAAVLMQMGVQGALGSDSGAPERTRGGLGARTDPGIAYQLGILFAAPTNNVEFALPRKVRLSMGAGKL